MSFEQINQEVRMNKNDPSKAKEFFEDKIAYTMGPVELNHILDADQKEYAIIDVRAANDYAAGHVPTAVNLPQDQWNTAQGLQKDKTNVLYCYSQTCHLAAKAAVEFAGKGYSVMEMEGGFKGWEGHGFEIEKENKENPKETRTAKRF
jgi:rhodanese-related sulfurtransferase